jgi:hypothetical protein
MAPGVGRLDRGVELFWERVTENVSANLDIIGGTVRRTLVPFAGFPSTQANVPYQ